LLEEEEKTEKKEKEKRERKGCFSWKNKGTPPTRKNRKKY